MGITDAIRGQFLDVIEYEDVSRKILVYKFTRPGGNNELKQGSKVIVRESQAAVFIKGGQLADILLPGTYILNTDNFPVLSTLKAFPFLFTSPVISDVYFISLRQFVENKWATKTPIMKRDAQFSMVRIRAFGKFAFRIIDIEHFVKEVMGTQRLMLTYEIGQYLSSMVTEATAMTIGETEKSVLDLATEYRSFSDEIQKRVNAMARSIGIEYSNVLIEGITLPDEVERLIDEQSGIGMARQDMQSFLQYQTARAMRDASKQDGGLAGLGAGAAMGKMVAQQMETISPEKSGKTKTEQLRELKELLDEGILTSEEFNAEKAKILGG